MVLVGSCTWMFGSQSEETAWGRLGGIFFLEEVCHWVCLWSFKSLHHSKNSSLFLSLLSLLRCYSSAVPASLLPCLPPWLSWTLAIWNHDSQIKCFLLSTASVVVSLRSNRRVTKSDGEMPQLQRIPGWMNIHQASGACRDYTNIFRIMPPVSTVGRYRVSLLYMKILELKEAREFR